MDIPLRIDIVPFMMTEQAIIRHVKGLGYDPRVNRPGTAMDLLTDLWQNEGFREWASGCLAGDIDTAHDGLTCDGVHYVMGERTPVWSKRIHILLSVILSDQW